MNRNGGILTLVVGFLFTGYLLVYAAVANGGKLAATPWEALRSSAYDDVAGAGGASSGSKHSTSTWDTLIGSPGQRGVLGNWLTKLWNAAPTGSPEPAADIHATVHRLIH